MTTIHIWHAGAVHMDQWDAFRENADQADPFTGYLRPNTKKFRVPVSVYFVEHPKGKILIDTGWSEEVSIDPYQHTRWFSSPKFKGSLPPGQSVRERLALMSLKDSDIDYVLLTHLHADHVGGVAQVRNAKRILTSELEWQAAQRGFGYCRSLWKGVPIQTFQLETIPHGPYNLGLDLLGDGSVYLVHTPGYSKGHFSVMVDTLKGWVLLVGDAGFAQRSWRDFMRPGLTWNNKAAARSQLWLQEFSRRNDCWHVIANHDPHIAPITIE